MPQLSANDAMLQYIAGMRTNHYSQISSLPLIRQQPVPIDSLIKQVVSDRLSLSGYHLIAADSLLLAQSFRTTISRFYYAMYHAARAITFADNKGDDYERHQVLPNHLPIALPNRQYLVSNLNTARLLRNEADYDLYPVKDDDWKNEARTLAGVASKFCEACEEFALDQGYV